jgi:hypothetical protein
MNKPIHAHKLPAGTWPATLAVTPRGNVIISRAFSIAINHLKERELKEQKGDSGWMARETLEQMEEMFNSGIFFNNHED